MKRPRVAKDVLETTRKPAGTRNCANSELHLDKMEKKFRSIIKGYMSV